MNILIIGATGSIGKAVTHKLVNEYNVNLTLFSRKATTLPKLDNVSRINGDVMNYNDLKFAMNNIDTVFIALIGDLPSMIKNIVRVVIDTSVKKIVFIASMGIYNEIPDTIGAMGNVKFNAMLKPYQEAAKIIENSDLNYTIIRPAWFDNGDDEYEITAKGSPFGGHNVSRNAIADLASKTLTNLNYANHESLGINRPE